jgi:hypothetical protein
MDPRQFVNPGDPIRLAASQVNGLNRLLSVGGGFGAASAPEQQTPYTWVMAKNNTGVAVSRWGVLAITGMAISPSGNGAAQFEQLPVVTGGTPGDTTTAWCIAVEPIQAGAIGRVAVGGAVQCKVTVNKEDDKFTGCSAGGLTTGQSGEGLILWKESGVGSGKWALVRLASASPSASDRGIKRGTFTAPWNKGGNATVSDSLVSDTTYSARNYFANITGSGTKNCAIAYVGTEWILIAAEC